MSRRRPEGDPVVGSDAFLDVIANIVGILIILIVVAGVRVSRAPVAVGPSVQPPAPQAGDTEKPVPSVAGLEIWGVAFACDVALNVRTLIAHRPAAPPQPPPPAAPPVPIEPSPELLRQLAALERDLSRAPAEMDSRLEPLDDAIQRSRALEQRLSAADALLSEEAEQLAAVQRRLSALNREADTTQAMLVSRRRELDQAARRQPETRQIHHRLTPFSRTVDGPEIHFHLAAGRVAYVPVEELVELLRADIQRQKDWLLRVPRHEGQVGPIGGFSMAYVVERQSMSVLEELRVGGVVRVSVSEWRIVPGPRFPSESAAEALRPGSAFLNRLRMNTLDTTLTFWVYPDSFAEFRQLQELARAEGFTVAARPLPPGTPIAASPQGTRSAGQ